MPYNIAAHSFSFVEYFFSDDVNFLLKYKVGCSSAFSSFCAKTILYPKSDAFVYKINGFEKSGACKAGLFESFSFNVLNA